MGDLSSRSMRRKLSASPHKMYNNPFMKHSAFSEMLNIASESSVFDIFADESPTVIVKL